MPLSINPNVIEIVAGNPASMFARINFMTCFDSLLDEIFICMAEILAVTLVATSQASIDWPASRFDKERQLTIRRRQLTGARLLRRGW